MLTFLTHDEIYFIMLKINIYTTDKNYDTVWKNSSLFIKKLLRHTAPLKSLNEAFQLIILASKLN